MLRILFFILSLKRITFSIRNQLQLQYHKRKLAFGLTIRVIIYLITLTIGYLSNFIKIIANSFKLSI